jgi:hypothetical protein
MSIIEGYKCSLCSTERTMDISEYEGGPTLMETLGFTTLQIGDDPEMHVCEDCVVKLTDVINELVE